MGSVISTNTTLVNTRHIGTRRTRNSTLTHRLWEVCDSCAENFVFFSQIY